MRFEYTALDFEGRRVSGAAAAADEAALRGQLRDRGLRVLTMRALEEVPSEAPAPAGPLLTEAESAAAMAPVIQLTKLRQPLVEGLEAFAAEVPTRRLRRWLNKLRTDLAAGASLEDALPRSGLSPHLRELVRAGVQTGRLWEMLQRHVDLSTDMRRRRREMMLDLAYPCLVVCLAFATLAALCTILVPTLRDTYQSFGTMMPALSLAFLWAGSAGPWPISPASLAAVGACAAWAAAFGALAGFFGPWGEQAMRRLVSWLPGQKRVDRLANLAEYSLLLGMLIDGRVRLGPALRLAADATADRRLKRDSRRLADEIEQGRTLCEAVDRQPKLAREFYEFAEWSRHGPSFGERMVAASEMFASRAQVHQSLLSPCLIPLIYAGIVFLLGTTMFALLYPLVLLLNALA